MMRLVLIGDIHAYRRFMPPGLLLGKRLLGVTTVWMWRQFLFDQRLLLPVLTHAAGLQPDWVLFCGDVSNTALPGEFADVRQALDDTLAGIPALIVPGNHDRYTRRSRHRRALERHLGAYVPGQFPCFRHLQGRWHLLALDAAVPYLASASGRLGQDQVEAISRQIAGLTADDGLIVLCHYPIFYPPGTYHRPGHSLLDKEDLIALLRACPARTLYLHGHVHVPWRFTLAEPGLEHITLINAGAPTCRTRRHRFGQGFWQIDLPENPQATVRLLRHVPYAEPMSANNSSSRTVPGAPGRVIPGAGAGAIPEALGRGIPGAPGREIPGAGVGVGVIPGATGAWGVEHTLLDGVRRKVPSGCLILQGSPS